jgi:hypothetical protein
MAKKLIRLTESDLHKIVKESTHKILQEKNFRHEGDTFDTTKDYISKTKMRSERSTDIVISRLNQAKRNLVSLKGLYANMASSNQHAGQNVWRSTDLGYDEVGINIVDAIASIDKALESLGFSSNSENKLNFFKQLDKLDKKY